MEQSSTDKTVKSVSSKRFALSLIQKENSEYYISWKMINSDMIFDTGFFTDYSIATYVFNETYQDLEGN